VRKSNDEQEGAHGLVMEMFEQDIASQDLGIAVEQVGTGTASARMRVTARMLNGHGIAHGGYMFLLADTAFALACNTYGERTVARACEIVFVRPAREGDELIATAIERLRSGRSGIYDITVRRESGDREVIAEMRGHSAPSNPST
jgi:acyl-CoA thioesterase